MKSLPCPYDCLYNLPELGSEIEVSLKFEEIYENIVRFADKEQTIDCKELTDWFNYSQYSYIIRGAILWEIKLKKFYKQLRYKSFADYCEKELHFKVWQCNRLINAARVAIILIHNGFEIIPCCESQCRELSKYDDVTIIYYWQKILEKIEPHEITAIKIFLEIQTIREIEGEEVKQPRYAKIKVLNKFYEYLIRESLEYYMTISEYLQYLCGYGDYAEGFP